MSNPFLKTYLDEWRDDREKETKKLGCRRQTLHNLSLKKDLSLARKMVFSKFELFLMVRLSHRLSFTNLSQQQGWEVVWNYSTNMYNGELGGNVIKRLL